MFLPLPNHIHRKIFLFGIFLLVASLPFSKITLSISQLILFGNWLLEGNFKLKWQQIKSNKVFWIVASMFLIHLLGLFFTTNFDYAIKDLRIKIPLLILPLIFATTEPINKKTLTYLLLTFIGFLFIYSLISLYYLIFKPITDIRQISPFVSHIRLSLMIDFSILLAFYITSKKLISFKWINYFLYLLIFWFIIYLFIAESITGLIILSLFFIIYIFYYSISKRKVLYLGISIGILGLAIFSGIYLIKTIQEKYFTLKPYDFKTLETQTQYGNWYYNDTTTLNHENGYLTYIYICDAEMKDVWEKRSLKPYSTPENYFTEIRYTLIRYLTSKGERKDANAVYRLTDKEIKAIENGCANVLYITKTNIISRIHQLLWEYEQFTKYYNPNGQSLSQRFEFWKTSVYIFKKNWLTGVGIGDVNEAFEKAYIEMESPLYKEWRLRSHNQFLAIAVSLGFFGLLVFLISLILPAILTKKYRLFYYTAFFIIAVLSMLSEDTIETQVGVTFIAFFQSFFIFSIKDE